jgi:protein-tyrosine phosphatase
MIDLHSHFLYGVDDGPTTIDDSFELLKQAEQAGIDKILATPHFTDRSSDSERQSIEDVFQEIKRRLPEYHLRLDIQLAAEVGYSAELLNRLDQSWLLIGRKRHYMLFDIPMQWVPPDIGETIFQLVRRKVIPIMAHPERNSRLQKEPRLLEEWIRLGCIMQMDAGSITGQFGRLCQRVSRKWLAQGFVHLVASDAHDREQRNFHILAQARMLVEKKYGREKARLLLYENPRRILAGEQILRSPFVARSNGVNMLRKLSAKLKAGGGNV